MKKLFFIVLILTMLFYSCATYTVKEGKNTINPKTSSTTIIIDKTSTVETTTSTNEATSDLPIQLEVTYPIVFNKGIATLNDNYNKEVSVLLLPIEEDEELVTRYLKVINNYNSDIIMLTGSNTIAAMIIEELEKEAVIYKKDGSIISNYPLVVANNKAIAQLGQGHEVELLVRTLGEDRDLSTLDSNMLVATTKAVKKKEALKESLKDTLETPSIILGLTSYEPSFFDWTEQLKTFPYRMEYQWPISKYLETNFVDSYYDTIGNSEPQFAFTWSNSSVRERSDFIYIKGAIAVDSERVNLFEGSEVHSNHPIGRYGVYTKLVMLD